MSRIRAKKRRLSKIAADVCCVYANVVCTANFAFFNRAGSVICRLVCPKAVMSAAAALIHTMLLCCIDVALPHRDCYMFTFTAVNCQHVFSRLCIKANSIKIKTRWAETCRFFSGFILQQSQIIVHTFTSRSFLQISTEITLSDKIHFQRSSLLHKNTLQAQKTCLPSTTYYIHMKYF